MHVTGIRRYPVKSCRGESLDSAVVEPWGLAGDRRWMLVDDDGQALTAREVNHLLLVRPVLTAEGLRVEAPGAAPLEVVTPDPAAQRPVSVFSSTFTAASAGPAADDWFTAVAGRAVHLVHLDDPTRRATDPRFGRSGDVVSFADGYPLLLATEESLAALERDDIAMVRFRPNLVVGGAEAWAEDDWRRLRVGSVELRLVKGCARCVMTTVDPDTAVRGKEPIATLARRRRWDGATWFGVNAVPDLPDLPDQPEAVIRVGDPVEVLEAVPAGTGPLRAGSGA